MKKVLIALALILSGVCGAQAQVKDVLGIANHLGATFGVGTTGIAIEAATPITPFVQARAGLHIMPGIKFHVNSDVTLNGTFNGQTGSYDSEIDLDGSLKRIQGSIIFNVYPLGNKFPLFVAVGGYFGGRDMVKIKGYCPDAVGSDNFVEVGDYQLPLDETGHARGALRTNSFRPYIGIGTGRPCPSGRLNFMWELGVQFQGKPYLYDDINKSKVDTKFVEDNDDTFQKVMDHFTVYPVLKFTISGRIF